MKHDYKRSTEILNYIINMGGWKWFKPTTVVDNAEESYRRRSESILLQGLTNDV